MAQFTQSHFPQASTETVNPTEATEVIAATAQIVSALLSNPNSRFTKDDVPGIISDVTASLTRTKEPSEPVLVPAVPIKKSITPEFIICLEDGNKFKSLKRHLRTTYEMTPEQYRAKWNLPADYPMVAPNYAKERSDLAKKMGLGNRPKAQEAPVVVAAKGKGAKKPTAAKAAT